MVPAPSPRTLPVVARAGRPGPKSPLALRVPVPVPFLTPAPPRLLRTLQFTGPIGAMLGHANRVAAVVPLTPGPDTRLPAGAWLCSGLPRLPAWLPGWAPVSASGPWRSVGLLLLLLSSLGLDPLLLVRCMPLRCPTSRTAPGFPLDGVLAAGASREHVLAASAVKPWTNCRTHIGPLPVSCR